MRWVEFRKESIVFVYKQANLPRVIGLEIAIRLKRAFKPTPFCYSYERKAIFYFLQDFKIMVYVCLISVS